MKKNYSLIAAMLMLCSGSAMANPNWTNNSYAEAAVNLYEGGQSSVKAVRQEAINLEVLPFTLKANETKDVEVLMNNPGEAFTSIQFDLYLPEGVTLQSDEYGFYIELGSRTSSRVHQVECGRVKDGAIRVIILSLKNATFKNEEGDILRMTLQGASDLKGQVSEMQIKHIVLARPDATKYEPGNYEASIVTGTPADNHIALTGHYTAKAAQEISAALSAKTITSVDLNAAFVDDNASFATGNPNTLYYVSEGMKLGNTQNVVTVNKCDQLVLTDGCAFNAKQAFTATTATFTKKGVNTWSSVYLPYAAEIPADVTVGEFTNLEGNKATFAKATGMKAYQPYIFKGNGDVKFNASNVEVAVTPAPGNAAFEGTLTTLPAQAQQQKFLINNDGTAFIKTQGDVLPFSAYLNGNSALEKIEVNSNDVTGIEGVEAAADAMFPANVYGVDGKLVKKNAENLDELPHGVYIVNGVKINK